MLPDWMSKYSMIKENQKEVINTVLCNEFHLENFHEDQIPKEPEGCDFDTIGSTDVKDLALLIRGEHQLYFDAKEEYFEIRQREKSKQVTSERIFCCIKRYKHENKSTEMLNRLRSEFKDKIRNEELNIIAREQ